MPTSSLARARFASFQRSAVRAPTHSRTRTGALFGVEIEVGGAGVPEWQKTENAFGATAKEINAWTKSIEKKLKARAKSSDFPDCTKEYAESSDISEVGLCLTPEEMDANAYLRDTWNPMFAEWRKLTERAITGVPWGDDAELRITQGKIIRAREEFTRRSGYEFKNTLPPWSPDRGFFQAVKESTGVDVEGAAKGLLGNVPWSSIALAAGVGLGAVILLSRK